MKARQIIGLAWLSVGRSMEWFEPRYTQRDDRDDGSSPLQFEFLGLRFDTNSLSMPWT